MSNDTNTIPDIKHTKLVETIVIDEDTTQVTHTSYTDKLSSVKTEVSKKIQTNRQDLFKDLISCLEVITNKESTSVTIEVTTDKFYAPKLIIKTWTINQEYYGK